MLRFNKWHTTRTWPVVLPMRPQTCINYMVCMSIKKPSTLAAKSTMLIILLMLHMLKWRTKNAQRH
jgi:hypothetical protein